MKQHANLYDGDDFYVKSGPEDDPVWDWAVGDRHYTQTSTTFTKRQLRGNEIIYRPDGSVAEYPYNHERIENEKNALAFIARNTTIPVPRIVKWSDIDGVGSLTVETLTGQTFSDLYWELGPDDQKRLEKNMSDFLDNVLIPQLKQLRSKTMGQLGGCVYPPPRVLSYDRRPRWEAKIASTNRYVYCHNDLNFQNFMMNPETLEVEAIIDWEYSGFFPPEIEFPFYSYGKEKSLEEDHIKEMIALLDAPRKSQKPCRIYGRRDLIFTKLIPHSLIAYLRC